MAAANMVFTEPNLSHPEGTTGEGPKGPLLSQRLPVAYNSPRSKTLKLSYALTSVINLSRGNLLFFALRRLSHH